MQSEPCNRELRDALHRCRVLTSRASLAELRRLRSARLTWPTVGDLELRRQVDGMLNGTPVPYAV